MISIKAAFAVSMSAIGASTLGASAYVAKHPGGAATSLAAEPVSVPVRRTRFEFVSTMSTRPRHSMAPREIKIDPVMVYARDPMRTGARQTQEAVLKPCSEWRELASGPAGRRVKDLCLRAPD